MSSIAYISAPRSASKLDGQIGMRIRERRLALGLSQSQLADAIGVTFQQVQKYERGFNRIASSTLVAISQVLDVSPTDLLMEAPPPSKRTASVAEITRVASKLNGEGRARLLDAATQLAARREYKP